MYVILNNILLVIISFFSGVIVGTTINSVIQQSKRAYNEWKKKKGDLQCVDS